MVLDYSKWDALELSDDSDIEVHPNVDKKSFIRAKQNQIHQQRYQRRHEIDTLKYERIINDGLLERINALLDALKKHQDDARNPDELVFQALIESAGDPAKDEPPQPPEGVYTQQKESTPKFSKMIGSLIDQVKKDVDEKKAPNRYQDFIDGVTGHLTKVQSLQQELLVKLASLEKEESSKITSDSIHTGFNTSHVTKPAEKPTSPPAPKKEKNIELLNPKATPRDTLKQNQDDAISSGAEADIEDGSLGKQEDSDSDADMQPTPLGKSFAQIKLGDYRTCLEFISKNPSIVAERETDGLLVEAFHAQMDGKDTYARQCVHQALLLQYCNKLGRDGIGLFFKRITTKDHQAGKVFTDDVNSTYHRIKNRVIQLKKEHPPPNPDDPGIEQIQLHAVDPTTTIHIIVPSSDSQNPSEIAARRIFDNFAPDLQAALQAASLDAVNKVLGRLSVPEAEEVVRLLGEGGMLSLEEGVLDATTEEGRERLKEIEAENRVRVEEKAAAVAVDADADAEADAVQGSEGVEVGVRDEADHVKDRDGEPGDPE
jgi:cell division cycle protein 37